MPAEEYSGDIDVASVSILAREAFLNALESFSLKYQIDLSKGGPLRVVEVGREFIARNGRENL